MRELTRTGRNWRVREADTSHVPGARAGKCLIYEADGIIRRVWSYPADWRQLGDDVLWDLVEQQTPYATRRSGDPVVVSQRTRSLLELRLSHNRRRNLLDDCRRAREEMRVAVNAYAQALRRDGVPPERALVLLKEAVQTGLAGACDDEPTAEEVLHEGVEWCIAAYYAA